MSSYRCERVAPETLNILHCPNCGAHDIARDSASPWIFIGAVVLFPFGLLFFLLNKNS